LFLVPQEVAVSKVTIELRPSERKAIKDLAYLERRKPQDQVAHLVRCELERRGLVPQRLPVADPALEPAHAGAN
jgi:hypothetical protein